MHLEMGGGCGLSLTRTTSKYEEEEDVQESVDLIDLTKLRGSSCYGIPSLFQTNSRISTADFLPDLSDKVISQ